MKDYKVGCSVMNQTILMISQVILHEKTSHGSSFTNVMIFCFFPLVRKNKDLCLLIYT